MMESLPSDRAPLRRAAHNSIFFLFPTFLGLMSSHRADVQGPFPALFPSRFWHVPCWATLSKIRFEGTKKPIGWLASLQHLDRHPVSRPPSVVAAREAIHPHPHPSTHFEIFFRIFFRNERKWLVSKGIFPVLWRQLVDFSVIFAFDLADLRRFLTLEKRHEGGC